jgi:hypothetical protein
MKSMNIIGQSRWLTVLVVLFALTSGANGAENPNLDNISRALAMSSLTQADQIEVRTKAAAAINAGVPVEDVEIIVQQAVNRGVEAGSMGRFLDTSAATKKEGLPVKVILDRIEQGLAKRVPADRIAMASERLAEKLAEARPLVDGLIREGMSSQKSSERDEAVGSAARALEKSIPSEAVQGIGTAVRAKGGSLPLFTRSMDTAVYFTGSGMSPNTSSNLVQRAVESGYSERDLDGMVKQVDAEMRQGANAEEAASKMERNTKQGERGMGRQDMHQDRTNDRGRGAGSGMGGRGR